MKKVIKSLFISYDGLTDPLGQSQVLPYLVGLSNKGCAITIISFEKKQNFKQRAVIDEIVTQNNIRWIPLMYHKFPPILSTIFDVFVLKKTVKNIIHEIDILHCRGYITSIIGLHFKRKTNVKMLFDMRGFFADERVDGGLWKLSNPLFKSVYNYFKKKEKEFLGESDHVISLTHAGKKIINSWALTKEDNITVIPCCADLNHFDSKNVDVTFRDQLIEKYALKDKYVVSYLGGIGTWYMLPEMVAFFKVLLENKSNAVFLFITKEPQELVVAECNKQNVDTSKIIITSAKRDEVPTMLSLSNVGLFFIKPVFSKKASSPTKQGEYMAMGIPVICNAGVGDTDKIILDYKSGVLVKDTKREEYLRSIDLFNFIKFDTTVIRSGAENYFSLRKGINQYFEVYKSLN